MSIQASELKRALDLVHQRLASMEEKIDRDYETRELGEMMTVEEIIKRYKISRRTVYDLLRKEPELADAYIKVSGKLLIPTDALLKWEKSKNSL